MMQFAEQFLDFEIVSQAATQLSWACFMDDKIISLSEKSQSMISVFDENAKIGQSSTALFNLNHHDPFQLVQQILFEK
jgi:hypothetical protein